MGIAVLFCLCSEADAFVAANFSVVWPDASKLAFLVLGPMLDLKLLLMFTRVYRVQLIYTIVIALIVQVFTYTLIVDFLSRERISLEVGGYEIRGRDIWGQPHEAERNPEPEYTCPSCFQVHSPS